MKTIRQKPFHTFFRWVLLLAFGGSLLAALIPISTLKIDNRFEIWFYQDDPNLAFLHRGHALFGDWDWLSIYIHPAEGIYTEPVLRSIREITKKIEAMPDVRKVISPTNARGNLIEQDELAYQPILGNPPWSTEDIAKLRNNLDSNLAYRDGLIKPGSDRSALIMVQVKNREQDKGAYRVDLVDTISGLMESHRKTLGEFSVIGSPYLNAEINRSSRHDMFVFYPLVTTLVFVVAWIIFRNFRDVVITLTALSGASMWTVGLMMTRYELNIVTIMMPTVLVTVAVANVMHMIVSFHLARREHPEWSAEQAAKAVKRELWIPALGTTTTTAVGFLSLTQAGIFPVTLLGYFAALGIMVAYLLTFTLVPLLLTMLWSDRRKVQDADRAGDHRSLIHRPFLGTLSARTSLAHPYLAVGFFIALTAIICGRLPWLEADTNYVDLFHAASPVQSNYDTVEKAGYATSTVTLLFHTPLGFEEPSIFTAIQTLEEKIRALPETRKVLSPVNLIAEVDRALAENKQHWTPEFKGYGRESFAQLLLTAEISGNDDLKDLLSNDHKDFELTVMTDYMSASQLTQFAQRLEAITQATLPPDVQSAVTGLPVLWANMDRQLLASQSSILLSLIVPLAVIMLIIIRSVPLTIIGLIVNLLPVGLILGLMAWFDIKINIATILIGGITMGIAVDDTIHFLWHFRKELKRGKFFASALHSTYENTGTAILMTAFLLSAGFLVMAASDFHPTADFGWLTSLTVIVALVVEIFLMPALLRLHETSRLWLGGRRAGRSAEVAAESGTGE